MTSFLADSSGGPGRRRGRRTLVACLLILLAGAALIALVFSTEPVAERAGATRQTPMLVEVVTVTRGDHRPRIVAMGTVEATQDVILRPRVRGEVVERAPAFTPGGFVTAGQVVVRLDPADHENTLRQRRSDLHQTIADLELEMGRQNVAQRDYELLAEDLAARNEALVLREPQLLSAKARVDAAQAAVRQAELDLERTRVEAPFDAHVLAREVSLGSQVAAGDALGRLVGLDAYWVVTTLPRDELRWLELPASPDQDGATVTIRDRAAWPEGVTRTGRLYSQVGALDAETRLARVLVTVPDPLARQAAAAGSADGPAAGQTMPPLTIGAFVEVHIPGREMSDVVRLPRELIRQDDTVWVMEADSLRIRDVEIAMQDTEHAFVVDGLEDGDRVVVTDLATVADGAPLRLTGAAADTADAAGKATGPGAGP